MQEIYEGNRKVLIMSTLAFFISVMVWFNLAPLSSIIMEQLGITKEEIGVLMLVNLSLAIPARIFMGRLVDRFGPKRVFAVLLVVMSVPCFIFALSSSYWQLLISRLFLGIIGASFVVGIRMLAEWFPEHQAGFVQGIYAGWGNFGSAIASFSLPVLALLFGGDNGWRYAVAATGLLALIYGLVFYRQVEDTPPNKVFKRSKSSGVMEVTSFSDLIILLFISLPIYGGMGILVWSLQQAGLLAKGAAIGFYALLAILYLVHARKIWVKNIAYLKAEIHESEKYSMLQVSILSLGYFATFGGELAVISMLPMFFLDTYSLGTVAAGMIASSFAFTNLVARPAGGWLSDRFGRKRILMSLLFLLGVLYFAMSALKGEWSLFAAVALTMCCSMIGQAASGSVFSLVPSINKSKTGQIAGMVGAYGNIGSVCFLAVLNITYPALFFGVIGTAALLCFALSFFIKESPQVYSTDSQYIAERNYRLKVEQNI
ncbi:MFS transporter [Thalassobacillus devorans]|uniref:MFS transporter n=1 Tax=Thalassobacillus devorans TaxID=279813 RepID=UPI000A1CB2BD|nr:MFS transporter [Thalassobacillus devorans]